jgi:Domain of unknown function (DUF2760)
VGLTPRSGPDPGVLVALLEEAVVRLFTAIKFFFLILFNRKVAEAVLAAHQRLLKGESPTPKQAEEKIEGRQKALPTDVAASELGVVAGLLALLQREARFVDFLMEDVEGFGDADVGAVARSVHRGCRKALDQYLTLEAIRSEKEGDRLTVAAGFDPGALRLEGKVTGDPPFDGTLRHHGWKLVKANLPKPPAGQDASIVMPAEVEV